MKKLLLLFSLLLTFTLCASVPAVSPIKVYAGGGLSIPSRPTYFKDRYKMGFHGMAGLGMKVIPLVEGIGKIELQDFKSDISGMGGGTVKALMVGVDGKVAVGIPGLPVKPYALAGAGFAKIKQAEFKLPDSPSQDIIDQKTALTLGDQTKLYYNIGVGAEWKALPLVTLFVHGRLVYIVASQPNSVFDNDIHLWTITAGVKLL